MFVPSKSVQARLCVLGAAAAGVTSWGLAGSDPAASASFAAVVAANVAIFSYTMVSIMPVSWPPPRLHSMAAPAGHGAARVCSAPSACPALCPLPCLSNTGTLPVCLVGPLPRIPQHTHTQTTTTHTTTATTTHPTTTTPHAQVNHKLLPEGVAEKAPEGEAGIRTLLKQVHGPCARAWAVTCERREARERGQHMHTSAACRTVLLLTPARPPPACSGARCTACAASSARARSVLPSMAPTP